MKRERILLLILLMVPLMVLAQDTSEELRSDFNGIVNFFLPAVLGQISVLFADAKKYMGSGMWDWGVFWKTKIMPFLIVLAGSVAVYLVLVYAPAAKPLLEVFMGPFGEVTAALIFAGVQSLLDNVMKPTVDPSTRLAVNDRYNQPENRRV